MARPAPPERNRAADHSTSLGDSITSDKVFGIHSCPRPKQICDHPNNEPDKISHPASASPDSRSTASQIEFATGTAVGTAIGRLGRQRRTYWPDQCQACQYQLHENSP